MSNQTHKIDPQAWKYTEEASNWRDWGAVGLGLFIVVVGAFAVLLHIVGMI